MTRNRVGHIYELRKGRVGHIYELRKAGESLGSEGEAEDKV